MAYHFTACIVDGSRVAQLPAGILCSSMQPNAALVHLRPNINRTRCERVVGAISALTALGSASIACFAWRKRTRRLREQGDGTSPATVGVYQTGVGRWIPRAGHCSIRVQTQSVVCAASREGSINVAVNIGKAADQKRRRRLTEPQRRRLRLQEVKGKISALKGSAGARYKQNREQSPSEEDAEEEAEAEEEEEEEEEAQEGKDQESSEARAEWSWRRTGPSYGSKTKHTVSDDARAVANTELAGVPKASARQLIDTAAEFQLAKELEEAAELLELARKRIDMEQIQRKIDLPTAQALDDECTWMLARAYEQFGRLTLAVDVYGQLKRRSTRKEERLQAERKWAEVSFRLTEKLFGAMRYGDCLAVLEGIKEETTRGVVSDALLEDCDLYSAMALEKLGRLDEAKELLAYVRRTTMSRKRKAQALFILDVMSVDTTGQRNEEFQKMWEDNFKLPDDGYNSSARLRVGSSGGLNFTPREREFRSWASKYWEERLKSPLYYAFLTLWVTWPFAIPLVAIFKKAP